MNLILDWKKEYKVRQHHIILLVLIGVCIGALFYVDSEVLFWGGWLATMIVVLRLFRMIDKRNEVSQ